MFSDFEIFHQEVIILEDILKRNCCPIVSLMFVLKSHCMTSDFLVFSAIFQIVQNFRLLLVSETGLKGFLRYCDKLRQ